MTNVLDKLLKLQEAWQCQHNKRLDVSPDQLLKVARVEQRIDFWCDVWMSVFFLFMMAYFAWPAYRDIHKDWPWLISAASGAWVAGYILFNRWRRRDSAHFDESVLTHVERSIKDVEHRMWLERTQTLWYVLPIALGCMIPPVIFFAMHYSERPVFHSLRPLLTTEATFAALFYAVYWFLKNAGRMGLEARRKELEALREFRQTLLNGEANP